MALLSAIGLILLAIIFFGLMDEIEVNGFWNTLNKHSWDIGSGIANLACLWFIYDCFEQSRIAGLIAIVAYLLLVIVYQLGKAIDAYLKIEKLKLEERKFQSN